MYTDSRINRLLVARPVLKSHLPMPHLSARANRFGVPKLLQSRTILLFLRRVVAVFAADSQLNYAAASACRISCAILVDDEELRLKLRWLCHLGRSQRRVARMAA